MRRLPAVAAATALLSAGLFAGALDTAFAAKPPTFTTKDVTFGLNATLDRCAITLSWATSDPAAVESYLVQANNAPLKGRDTVQGNVVTETTSSWEFDDDTPFYIKVTVILVGGKESKSWSVGSDSWSCLP